VSRRSPSLSFFLSHTRSLSFSPPTHTVQSLQPVQPLMFLSSFAQVDIVSKECRPRNCTLAAVSYEDLVYMEKIGVRNYRRAVSISHLHAQLTSITCTRDTHKHTRTCKHAGKAFLGGLGGMSSKDSRSYYGVWACVRGWDEAEQRRCGVFVCVCNTIHSHVLYYACILPCMLT